MDARLDSVQSPSHHDHWLARPNWLFGGLLVKSPLGRPSLRPGDNIEQFRCTIAAKWAYADHTNSHAT